MGGVRTGRSARSTRSGPRTRSSSREPISDCTDNEALPSEHSQAANAGDSDAAESSNACAPVAPLDGRVRVAVRIRPLSARERLCGSARVLRVAGDALDVAPVCGPGASFAFDAVDDEDTPQAEVYGRHVRPLVARCVEGYNCTVLAYGQTGSGKTHTMMGAWAGDDGAPDADESHGVVPRAVSELFAALGEAEVYASFVEIYQEDIFDLLSLGAPRTLSIREDGSGGVVVAGAREERVCGAEDACALLRRGLLARTTKATDMNVASSRSHAVFTLVVRQKRGEASISSKMHFVDLAGSERLKRTHAAGQRAREAISINGGLLALGNVIAALASAAEGYCSSLDTGRKPAQARRRHVPYRDSKLTRMLQDALGGNSCTTMLACVSPAAEDAAETVNTLRYASRARLIRNTATVNMDTRGDAAFEAAQLRRLVAALRQEIVALRAGAGTAHSRPPESTIGGVSHGGDTAAERDAIVAERDAIVAERDALAAERDFYRAAASLPQSLRLDGKRTTNTSAWQRLADAQMPVIREHVHTIRVLREKLASGRVHGQPHDAPPTPGPAPWVGRANMAVVRARRLLVRPANGDAPGFAEETDAEDVREALADDMRATLAELVEHVHAAQADAAENRRRFAERQHLLAERVSAAERERDDAIALVSSLRRGPSATPSAPPGGNSPIGGGSHAQPPLGDVRGLRAAVAHLRGEKTRLQTQLDAATERLRTTAATESALRDARVRERRSAEVAARLQRTVDAQRALLARRAEQAVAAGYRARVLSAASPLRMSASPRFEKRRPSASPSRRQSLTPVHSAIRDEDYVDLGVGTVGIATADPRPATPRRRSSLTAFLAVATPPVPRHSRSSSISSSPSVRRALPAQPSSQQTKPAGHVPRSTLHATAFSSLTGAPIRRSVFARIADAASLSIVQAAMECDDGAPATALPTSPMKVD